jgi:sugar phosphate isomerase/epimerase
VIDPKRVFVHIPYELLANYRDVILKAGIALEVLVEPQNLRVATLESLAEEIREVKEASGRVALHSPYEGLDPGHSEEAEREEAIRLLTLTCGLAQAVGASYVVAHTGYDPARVKGDLAGWRRRSLETWKALIEQPACQGVSIALENTMEPEPSLVRSLVDALPEQSVGVCLDTGHLNCFASAPPPKWWASLGSRVSVLHLHDNEGEEDEHLGIGQGTFDFDALFRWLNRANVTPFFSIEGRDLQAVATSLSALGFPFDETLLGF